MIDLSQKLLSGLLLHSLIAGVIMGVIYDVIRLGKMLLGVEYGVYRERVGFTFKNAVTSAVTICSDVIFWLLFALCAVSLTYTLSGGVFRGLVYIGMLSGLCVYYFTLGKLTLKISSKISKVVKKTVRALIKIILIPLRAIFCVFVRLYRLTIGKIIVKIKEREKIRRQKRDAMAEKSSVAAISDGDGEEDINARLSGYKKENRISFGYKRV
jgi:hypothetical protein